MAHDLTNAEYALLGLLVERPSHGYDLEQTIEDRGMRKWTELAFSSIYFLLKKLEKRGLAASKPDPRKSTRKTYSPTPAGRAVFDAATLAALSRPHALYPSVLLGLANWPSADPRRAEQALRDRMTALETTRAEVEAARRRALGTPAFVDAIFDYSLSQLTSEQEWLRRTIDRLEEKHAQD